MGNEAIAMNNISIGDFIRQAEDTERQRTAIALTPIINYGMQYIQARKAAEATKEARDFELRKISYANSLSTNLMEAQQDKISAREDKKLATQKEIAQKGIDSKEKIAQQERDTREKIAGEKRLLERGIAEDAKQRKQEIAIQAAEQKKLKDKKDLDKELAKAMKDKETATDNDSSPEYKQYLDERINEIKDKLARIDSPPVSQGEQQPAKKATFIANQRGLPIYSFDGEKVPIPYETSRKAIRIQDRTGVDYNTALLYLYNSGKIRKK